MSNPKCKVCGRTMEYHHKITPCTWETGVTVGVYYCCYNCESQYFPDDYEPVHTLKRVAQSHVQEDK